VDGTNDIKITSQRSGNVIVRRDPIARNGATRAISDHVSSVALQDSYSIWRWELSVALQTACKQAGSLSLVLQLPETATNESSDQTDPMKQGRTSVPMREEVPIVGGRVVFWFDRYWMTIKPELKINRPDNTQTYT
jgi:hypothetical protein